MNEALGRWRSRQNMPKKDIIPCLGDAKENRRLHQIRIGCCGTVRSHARRLGACLLYTSDAADDTPC
eukprot:3528436-Pyramimonas_sp.AAC.1